ncbi:hypothetical protein J5A66_03525 [Prevotella sp. oral taxon 475]|uniref:hypothetical protein n=1 Tax=Prevotella sp. oral taxon 475 TaxID=712471 RepID=UPI001BAD5ECE|nr:hypothetical protein [Prevotella sp. oral taxon 475]QUB47882.1 hypothetical protein J5A66_03525 [Prevotella sp. oral taxon 475]
MKDLTFERTRPLKFANRLFPILMNENGMSTAFEGGRLREHDTDKDKAHQCPNDGNRERGTESRNFVLNEKISCFVCISFKIALFSQH